MKASETKFEEFLSQPQITFLIPVYQRNYDWNNEQCKEFLKDIEILSEFKRKNHFLGSIVYIKSIENDLKEFIIIDGQQRITTSLLFLKAIHDITNDDFDKREIYEQYLTNKVRSGIDLKLQLIKTDNEVFTKLLKEDIVHSNSRIYKNYKYFYDYLKNKSEIGKYFKAFKQLWIVYIELDRERDSPQLIFESINSTGLNLSEADLIRNFILMDREPEEQNNLFNNYWSKIEELLSNEVVSNFIRDYLTMKTTYIPKKNKVYIEFKNYLLKYEILDKQALLEDLVYYARIYSNFLFPNYKNINITNIMKEIKELKKTVSYPYFLHLFNEYNKGYIDDIILIKSIELIRTYIFRRLICKSNNNIFTSLFANLHKEVKKISNINSNYYENLTIVLTNKQGNEIFPRDEEFKNNFLTKDIYNSKDKLYLLYSLESFNNKELVPLNNLSIEHIMPQTLSEEWESILGNNFRITHEEFLHTIGNLTLTAYNSNLSNKLFFDKKKIFKESNINLNSYFDIVDSWNKEEIEKRARYIFNEIVLKIWFFPKVNKNLLQDYYLDCYNLSDEFNPTGRKINKIKILNKELMIKDWRDSFFQIVKFLYLKDKNLFDDFFQDNKGTERKIFSEIETQFKIDNNIYLNIEGSSKYVVSQIKIISQKCKLKEDDILFYLIKS